MNNSQGIIRLESIRKSYFMGKNELEVLKGISLDIFKNEYVALMGPSGSGKSTLLRQIIGLERPESGTVVVKGTDITRCSQSEMNYVHRAIGVTFQSGALFNSLTLENNVALNLREHTELAPPIIDLTVSMLLADPSMTRPRQWRCLSRKRVLASV